VTVPPAEGFEGNTGGDQIQDHDLHLGLIPAAPFGRDVIELLIPHRAPFLLVDEILELEPGKRVGGRRAGRREPAPPWGRMKSSHACSS